MIVVCVLPVQWWVCCDSGVCFASAVVCVVMVVCGSVFCFVSGVCVLTVVSVFRQWWVCCASGGCGVNGDLLQTVTEWCCSCSGCDVSVPEIQS